ncbi:MAG: hypothetical protein ABFQ95_01085 [Pseudomonadota bacterium]
MAKTYGDAEVIMRRVVGQNDGDDPDATTDLFIRYLSDFVTLIMGQDIKSQDLYSWFAFDTVSDQDTYDFKDQGFTNIFPLVRADGNDMRYWEDPDRFFDIWPDTVDSTTNTGRPTDMLFYNNQLLLRPVPDQAYEIKLRGYKELPSVTDGSTKLEQDYFLRYIAYGASLDYLTDFGDHETYTKIFPIYQRYRSLVLTRTAAQQLTQRPLPAL